MARWLQLNFGDSGSHDDLRVDDLSNDEIRRHVKQLARSLGKLGAVEWVWFSVTDPDIDEYKPILMGTYRDDGKFFPIDENGEPIPDS